MLFERRQVFSYFNNLFISSYVGVPLQVCDISLILRIMDCFRRRSCWYRNSIYSDSSQSRLSSVYFRRNCCKNQLLLCKNYKEITPGSSKHRPGACPCVWRAKYLSCAVSSRLTLTAGQFREAITSEQERLQSESKGARQSGAGDRKRSQADPNSCSYVFSFSQLFSSPGPTQARSLCTSVNLERLSQWTSQELVEAARSLSWGMLACEFFKVSTSDFSLETIASLIYVPCLAWLRVLRLISQFFMTLFLKSYQFYQPSLDLTSYPIFQNIAATAQK